MTISGTSAIWHTISGKALPFKAPDATGSVLRDACCSRICISSGLGICALILLQFSLVGTFGADLGSEPGSLQEFQDWNLFWKKVPEVGDLGGGTYTLWAKNSHTPQPGSGIGQLTFTSDTYFSANR